MSNKYCNCCACKSCCMCHNCCTCCTLEQAILDICQYDDKYFLSKENVVGLGLGYKVIKGHTTNEKCIKVYVSKKFFRNQLYPQDIIPNCYKGIKTDVVKIGRIHAMSLVSKIRPFPSGYSVGPACSCHYGTYGCLVKDNNNNYYLLSSNHVLANENNLPINTPILQPSSIDCGHCSQDVVAKLSKYIPLCFMTPYNCPTNYVDCAIAKVLNLSSISPEVTFLGTIKGLSMPKLGECVRKVGRTTGLTMGKIDSIGTTIVVDYSSGKSALFKNQIVTTSMAYKGDSGSVLLNNENQIVGLGCGTSNKATVFNTMVDVLTYLNVNIVDK